jgi:hypothetical protein
MYIVRNCERSSTIRESSGSLFRRRKMARVITQYCVCDSPNLPVVASSNKSCTGMRQFHGITTQQSFLSQRTNCSYPVTTIDAIYNSKLSSRYQTTVTTNHGGNKNMGNNKTQIIVDEEEERLLQSVEEIVDVPSSALEEVIDRSKFTDKIPVPMPDLGTSNGNSPDRLSKINEWFFKPGDIVQHEDVLCDIETPEFTFGMETDDEEVTIMGEILVPVGTPVPDGTVLCYMLHESKGDKQQSSSEEASAVSHNDDDDDDDDDEDQKNSDDDDKMKDDDNDKSKV